MTSQHDQPRLHVSSDRAGVWRVHPEGEQRALSEHPSETDAERAAARHAAATGAREIVVHDRYNRVHSAGLRGQRRGDGDPEQTPGDRS